MEKGKEISIFAEAMILIALILITAGYLLFLGKIPAAVCFGGLGIFGLLVVFALRMQRLAHRGCLTPPRQFPENVYKDISDLDMFFLP